MSVDPIAARIGIDLGGTKIEGIVLGPDGAACARLRLQAPRDDYGQTLDALQSVIAQLEDASGRSTLPVGLAIPGSISKRTRTVQNANSVWLNGQALDRDLACRLGRPVRVANDANCFALSEATDGAAAGAASVFGVILGTGTGGGLVIGGRVLDGPLGIAGEWGHNPLPWADTSETPGAQCWCSRFGCMETWVSGPAIAADHARTVGQKISTEDIVQQALHGDADARATLDRHQNRLARGLAHVVNIFDPDVIVLGGGLSKLGHLYYSLPGLMKPYILADAPFVDVRPPKWGDASGVRGAAWLNPAVNA